MLRGRAGVRGVPARWRGWPEGGVMRGGRAGGRDVTAPFGISPQGVGQGDREQRHVCLAIPRQIVEITDEVNRLASVDVVGVGRTVNTGLLDAPRPGDCVLIHV